MSDKRRQDSFNRGGSSYGSSGTPSGSFPPYSSYGQYGEGPGSHDGHLKQYGPNSSSYPDSRGNASESYRGGYSSEYKRQDGRFTNYYSSGIPPPSGWRHGFQNSPPMMRPPPSHRPAPYGRSAILHPSSASSGHSRHEPQYSSERHDSEPTIVGRRDVSPPSRGSLHAHPPPHSGPRHPSDYKDAPYPVAGLGSSQALSRAADEDLYPPVSGARREHPSTVAPAPGGRLSMIASSSGAPPWREGSSRKAHMGPPTLSRGGSGSGGGYEAPSYYGSSFSDRRDKFSHGYGSPHQPTRMDNRMIGHHSSMRSTPSHIGGGYRGPTPPGSLSSEPGSAREDRGGAMDIYGGESRDPSMNSHSMHDPPHSMHGGTYPPPKRPGIMQSMHPPSRWSMVADRGMDDRDRRREGPGMRDDSRYSEDNSHGYYGYNYSDMYAEVDAEPDVDMDGETEIAGLAEEPELQEEETEEQAGGQRRNNREMKDRTEEKAASAEAEEESNLPLDILRSFTKKSSFLNRFSTLLHPILESELQVQQILQEANAASDSNLDVSIGNAINTTPASTPRPIDSSAPGGTSKDSTATVEPSADASKRASYRVGDVPDTLTRQRVMSVFDGLGVNLTEMKEVLGSLTKELEEFRANHAERKNTFVQTNEKKRLREERRRADLELKRKKLQSMATIDSAAQLQQGSSSDALDAKISIVDTMQPTIVHSASCFADSFTVSGNQIRSIPVHPWTPRWCSLADEVAKELTVARIFAESGMQLLRTIYLWNSSPAWFCVNGNPVDSTKYLVPSALAPTLQEKFNHVLNQVNVPQISPQHPLLPTPATGGVVSRYVQYIGVPFFFRNLRAFFHSLEQLRLSPTPLQLQKPHTFMVHIYENRKFVSTTSASSEQFLKRDPTGLSVAITTHLPPGWYQEHTTDGSTTGDAPYVVYSAPGTHHPMLCFTLPCPSLPASKVAGAHPVLYLLLSPSPSELMELLGASATPDANVPLKFRGKAETHAEPLATKSIPDTMTLSHIDITSLAIHYQLQKLHMEYAASLLLENRGKSVLSHEELLRFKPISATGKENNKAAFVESMNTAACTQEQVFVTPPLKFRDKCISKFSIPVKLTVPSTLEDLERDPNADFRKNDLPLADVTNHVSNSSTVPSTVQVLRSSAASLFPTICQVRPTLKSVLLRNAQIQDQGYTPPPPPTPYIPSTLTHDQISVLLPSAAAVPPSLQKPLQLLRFGLAMALTSACSHCHSTPCTKTCKFSALSCSKALRTLRYEDGIEILRSLFERLSSVDFRPQEATPKFVPATYGAVNLTKYALLSPFLALLSRPKLSALPPGISLSVSGISRPVANPHSLLIPSLSWNEYTHRLFRPHLSEFIRQQRREYRARTLAFARLYVQAQEEWKRNTQALLRMRIQQAYETAGAAPGLMNELHGHPLRSPLALPHWLVHSNSQPGLLEKDPYLPPGTLSTLTLSTTTSTSTSGQSRRAAAVAAAVALNTTSSGTGSSSAIGSTSGGHYNSHPSAGTDGTEALTTNPLLDLPSYSDEYSVTLEEGLSTLPFACVSNAGGSSDSNFIHHLNALFSREMQKLIRDRRTASVPNRIPGHLQKRMTTIRYNATSRLTTDKAPMLCRGADALVSCSSVVPTLQSCIPAYPTNYTTTKPAPVKESTSVEASPTAALAVLADDLPQLAEPDEENSSHQPQLYLKETTESISYEKNAATLPVLDPNSMASPIFKDERVFYEPYTPVVSAIYTSVHSALPSTFNDSLTTYISSRCGTTAFTPSSATNVPGCMTQLWFGSCNCPVSVQKEYDSSVSWSDTEKLIFIERFFMYPKGFHKISQQLPNKTPGDCIAFYYLTKPVIKWKVRLKAQTQAFRKRAQQMHVPWLLAAGVARDIGVSLRSETVRGVSLQNGIKKVSSVVSRLNDLSYSPIFMHPGPYARVAALHRYVTTLLPLQGSPSLMAPYTVLQKHAVENPAASKSLAGRPVTVISDSDAQNLLNGIPKVPANARNDYIYAGGLGTPHLPWGDDFGRMVSLFLSDSRGHQGVPEPTSTRPSVTAALAGSGSGIGTSTTRLYLSADMYSRTRVKRRLIELTNLNIAHDAEAGSSGGLNTNEREEGDKPKSTNSSQSQEPHRSVASLLHMAGNMSGDVGVYNDTNGVYLLPPSVGVSVSGMRNNNLLYQDTAYPYLPIVLLRVLLALSASLDGVSSTTDASLVVGLGDPLIMACGWACRAGEAVGKKYMAYLLHYWHGKESQKSQLSENQSKDVSDFGLPNADGGDATNEIEAVKDGNHWRNPLLLGISQCKSTCVFPLTSVADDPYVTLPMPLQLLLFWHTHEGNSTKFDTLPTIGRRIYHSSPFTPLLTILQMRLDKIAVVSTPSSPVATPSSLSTLLYPRVYSTPSVPSFSTQITTEEAFLAFSSYYQPVPSHGITISRYFSPSLTPYTYRGAGDCTGSIPYTELLAAAAEAEIAYATVARQTGWGRPTPVIPPLAAAATVLYPNTLPIVEIAEKLATRVVSPFPSAFDDDDGRPSCHDDSLFDPGLRGFRAVEYRARLSQAALEELHLYASAETALGAENNALTLAMNSSMGGIGTPGNFSARAARTARSSMDTGFQTNSHSGDYIGGLGKLTSLEDGKKVVRTRWTEAELQLFEELLETHGKNWAVITSHFPGRASAAIRSLYQNRFRKNQKGNKSRLSSSVHDESAPSFPDDILNQSV